MNNIILDVMSQMLDGFNKKTLVPSAITSFFLISKQYVSVKDTYGLIGFIAILFACSFVIMFLLWGTTYLFDKFIRLIFPIVVAINNRFDRIFTRWIKHQTIDSQTEIQYLSNIYDIYVQCFHYALPAYFVISYLNIFSMVINISIFMSIIFIGFCHLLTHYLFRHVSMDFQGFWGSGTI